MGNPYLFNQINHYFETGEILPDLTFEDKMKIAYEHLKRLISLKGEKLQCVIPWPRSSLPPWEH